MDEFQKQHMLPNNLQDEEAALMVFRFDDVSTPLADGYSWGLVNAGPKRMDLRSQWRRRFLSLCHQALGTGLFQHPRC